MSALTNVGGLSTVSEARLRANRRNAERSTGPKTPEGKAKSRANALKHSLTGEGVVIPPAMAEARAARLDAWTRELRPETPLEAYFLDRAVLASVRMDACAAAEAELAEQAAQRAAACWDQDRNLDVETLAAGLAKRPGRVVAELQTTWHGAAWLLARWEALAASLVEQGPWDLAQRTRALDLLGVPTEERQGDPLGLAVGGVKTQQTLADRERTRLQELLEVLEPLDADDRERIETRRDFDLSRKAQALRRHEAACERTYFRALNELRRLQSDRRKADRSTDLTPLSWAIADDDENENEIEIDNGEPDPETGLIDEAPSSSRWETLGAWLALLGDKPSPPPDASTVPPTPTPTATSAPAPAPTPAPALAPSPTATPIPPIATHPADLQTERSEPFAGGRDRRRDDRRDRKKRQRQARRRQRNR